MKNSHWKGIVLGLLSIVLVSSCTTLNRSRMFKTPRSYNFEDWPDSTAYMNYRIASNDWLEIYLFSKKGFKFIPIAGSNGNNNNGAAVQNRNIGFGNGLAFFVVDERGQVKLPILGRIDITGLTIREAEARLEKLYSEYYQDPFVILKINNKRVFLFTGGNNARVVSLDNDNTTLFEVLAKAGGIPDRGNAKNVKLIRGDLKNPKVYKIDLSTLEGIKDANLVMQANDIVYVEPVINFFENIRTDLVSWTSMVSAILVAWSMFRLNNNQ